MPKVVDLQIRKIPALLRDRLRRRAKGKGLSMSEYVIDLLREDLDRPTMAEWVEEVRNLPWGDLRQGESAAESVRRAREERDREMDARFERIAARRAGLTDL